ncbi:MAG TPA: hypothetical protein VIT44_06315 [Cyclobacteriaceae bacterium]
MRRLKQFLIIILSTVLLSCATTKSTSILYSDNYDQTADRTSIMIFPYGEIKVPGKWTKTGDNAVSGQYFYTGQDSVRIAIALQPWDKYEFSHNNPEVTTDNFVRKFYEWDANYLREQTGGQLKIIKEDKQNNFLIWNLSNGTRPQDYFLFGLKGKVAYNLNVTTDKWDEGKKVKFLEQLFSE